MFYRTVIAIFWNRAERRPRAGWRLLCTVVIAAIAAVVLTVGLVELGIPLTEDSVVVFIAIQTAATLVAVWLGGRWLDRRKLRDFGLRFDGTWWLDFAAGLAIGAIAITAAVLVQLAMGWARIGETFVAGDAEESFGLAFAQGVFLFIAVGFSEELITRGYVFRNLAEGLHFRRLGPRVALAASFLLSGGLFYALHLGNPNFTPYSHVNLCMASILLAIPVLLTGQLAMAIGTHITWNLFQGVVFGYPVSGQTIPMTLFAIDVTGPEHWTGGAFGVEGGLLGVLANVASIAATLAWFRWRRGELRLYLDWTEYRPAAGDVSRPAPPEIQSVERID